MIPLRVGIVSVVATLLMWSSATPAAESEDGRKIPDCSPNTKMIEGRSAEGYQARWCQDAKGRKRGEYYEWFTTGEPKVEAHFVSGILEGPYQSWYKNGRLEKEGMFFQNEMTGMWTRWHRNGEKRDYGMWLKEKPHGVWKIWNKKGDIQGYGKFNRGQRICKWLEWDGEGKRKSVQYPEPEEGCKDASQNKFHVSAGYTYLIYTETNVERINLHAVTAKASYRDLLPWGTDWTWGATAFVNVSPFSKNSAGQTLQFIGLNLRVGKRVPLFNYPWALTLLGGAYYITTLTQGPSFAFEHKYGPQLFPVLSRIFDGGDVVSWYAKYSPIMKGFGFYGLDSGEFATGLAWSTFLKDQRQLIMELNFAMLMFNPHDSLAIKATSASLGVGFGF